MQICCFDTTLIEQKIKKEPNELLFLSENLFRLTFQITLPY